MKKSFFLLILLLCASKSFSLDVGGVVTSLSVEIAIRPDISVEQTIQVSVFNQFTVNSSYTYIFLNDIPSEVSVTDEEGREYNYTSFVANGIFTMRLIDIINPKTTKTYYLKYSNNDIVQSFDKNYVFSYHFTSYYELESFNIQLTLPAGFGITRRDVNTVSPPSSKIFSDGQQIIIEWEQDLDYLGVGTYFVLFERLGFSNISTVWVFGALFAGFLLGGGTVYYILKRKRKEIVTMALTGDEKKIVDFIILKNNNVYQNDIGRELDFSKPKLSKIVHNLQEKNIIVLTPAGRKNKVSVNKKVL